MNVFLRELKANYKSLFWWSTGMVFLIISGMAKYEGYSASSASGNIGSLLATLPKSILAIFGMSGLDVTTLTGYFGVLYLYIAIMVAIHAGLLGSTIIAKEERDRTSEFLYPKPVTRTRVLTAKLTAAVVNILTIFAVSTATSLWIVSFYNKGGGLNNQIMSMMWGILLFQLLAFSFGAVFAGLFKNPKLSASAVTTVIMTSYLVSVSVDLNEKLNFLKHLTPFQYFSAPKIIAEGHLDLPYVILAMGVSAVLIVLTYIFYNKRDLNV